MQSKTKDFPVDGRNFQLRKMKPLVGSHIYLRMMGAMLDYYKDRKETEPSGAPQEVSQEDRARALINVAFMKGFDLAESQLIQMEALKVVSSETVAGTGAYSPVMNDSGLWADKELESDPRTIHKLVQESLVFNIYPFLS